MAGALHLHEGLGLARALEQFAAMRERDDAVEIALHDQHRHVYARDQIVGLEFIAHDEIGNEAYVAAHGVGNARVGRFQNQRARADTALASRTATPVPSE